jgi:hypothetical protein
MPDNTKSFPSRSISLEITVISKGLSSVTLALSSSAFGVSLMAATVMVTIAISHKAGTSSSHIW